MSVCKGRCKFNRNVRNGKKHVRIFPAGGDPLILPRKISFRDSVKKDVLFAEKVVPCYRCKTRYMLGKNYPVASPTPDDPAMSFSEQSDAPLVNQTSLESETNIELCPSGKSQQDTSTLSEVIPSQGNSLGSQIQIYLCRKANFQMEQILQMRLCQKIFLKISKQNLMRNLFLIQPLIRHGGTIQTYAQLCRENLVSKMN